MTDRDEFGWRITARRIEALGNAVATHRQGERHALGKAVCGMDVRAPEWSAVDEDDPERTTATEVRWLLKCDADRKDGSAEMVTTEVAGTLSAGGQMADPVVRYLVRGNTRWYEWQASTLETAKRTGKTLREAAEALTFRAQTEGKSNTLNTPNEQRDCGPHGRKQR